MLNKYELFTLLVFEEECDGLPLAEAVEYIGERIRERYPDSRMAAFFANTTFVKRSLFKGRYGEDAIPRAATMLSFGQLVNFELLSPEEEEELEIFTDRWNKMF